ncbi:MAG: ATP-binding cassette domain-containing protein [Betaproteobacteria bacterium]|nr:ATP-binding cassette domain-containing protein [Betaproteobacteria bacterium]
MAAARPAGRRGAHGLGAVRRQRGGTMSRGPESAPMLAAAPVLVRLQGAGVRFGAHTVLQAVDLEVHAGERRAQQALERVNLAEHAHRPARVLSGGQQQRLALARAWAVRPQLLFLDEPTASLDPAAKRDVEALIEEFAAEGMTVVMSTHNLGQAKRLATRVVYLEAGQLVVDRPVAAFFHEPLPDAAAQFLSGERT